MAYIELSGFLVGRIAKIDMVDAFGRNEQMSRHVLNS